jgi:signal transduction histidine kinase
VSVEAHRALTPFRKALLGLGAAGIVMGILMVVVIVTSDHTDYRGVEAASSLLVAWSFLGTGLYAWDRRPDNLIGPLMVAVAFTWYLAELETSNIPALFVAGAALASAPFGFIVHMLFAFPDGRLKSRASRAWVAYAYVLTVVLSAIPVLFIDSETYDDCQDCPPNPLLVTDAPGTADALYAGINVCAVIGLGAVLAHFIRRAREAEPSERSRDAPVWFVGGVMVLLLAAALVTNFTPEEGNYDDVIFYSALLALASVPFAFLVGVLRSKLTETELENVRLDTELQARLDELRESRARIVAAEASARRKLERDLHDGAQQRLVSLALDLRLARSRMQEDPEGAAALLDEAQMELARATEELRELARGIHPAVLSDRGLGAAVDALAARAPFPVEVDTRVDGRLPDPVEAAAYFVVAEALTNIARHAGADRAEVGIKQENGRLRVEVHDDGEGGADMKGSGLRGLSDRVAALDGDLEVASPRGRGTVVRASIPVAQQDA